MKPIKGLRWWIIGLVLSGLIMNYLARNALAVAAPEVNKVLNISTQQYGYIVAAFQAAYMVMQPVAGYVLDVLGTKLGFALFAAAWSVVCLLHSTAGSWLSLAAFRAMLGMTEAAGFPSALRATAEWFPAKERALAIGIFNAGANVGAILTPLLIWLMVPALGWRMTFFITGIFGIVWLIAWLAIYRDKPHTHKRVGQEELDHISQDPADPDVKVIVLSMYDTVDFVKRAVSNGACGYLMKDAPPFELEQALRSVMATGSYFSAAVAQRLLQPSEPSVDDELTQRQVEILTLIAQGKSAKEIAFELGLSPKTVDVHRARIMERLRLNDIASLTRYAVRKGLVKA